VNISSQNQNYDQTHFYRFLRKIEQDVLRMGSLVEESFRQAHQCLFERNLDAANKIKALDKQIDQYYHKIELDCATLIALKSPVAQDLRSLTAFMQLVRDLERIGDYAKDLAEIALKLFPYPVHSSMDEIAAMSQHAQLMLATSLVALADLDALSGQAVKQLDDTVDDAYDRLYYTLAYQKNITGVIEPILLLVLVIRHLERMADHATNIGQRVFYIVTGKIKSEVISH